jgi:hypothetical protein
MTIAVYIFAGSLIVLVGRILTRQYRAHSDCCIPMSRFEVLKAHEQEMTMQGKRYSTP